MSGVFCCMLFFLPKAWLQLRLNGKAECAKRISVVRFLKQVYKPTDAILKVSKVFKLKLRFKKASFYHKLPNRTECEESTCTLETLPSGFPTDCEQTLVLIRLDSFRSNIWGVVVHFRSSFATIHLYTLCKAWNCPSLCHISLSVLRASNSKPKCFESLWAKDSPRQCLLCETWLDLEVTFVAGSYHLHGWKCFHILFEDDLTKHRKEWYALNMSKNA